MIPTPRSIFRNLGFLLALILGLGYAGAAEAAADSAAVEKMIIDLRHNGGGNSAVFRRRRHAPAR